MHEVCELGANAAREALSERIAEARRQMEPLGSHSVDGIHDMRVASRRLRAAIKEFRKWLPENQCKAWTKKIRRITQSLGRPRELDVMLLAIKSRTTENVDMHEALSFAACTLERLRDDADAQCEDALRIVQNGTLSEEADALLGAASPRQQCFVLRLGKRLARQLDEAASVYDTWICAPNADDLHRLRIACKKLRYACEIHARHYPGHMPGFIRHLKSLQDSLGRWNDTRLLLTELRALPKEVLDTAPPAFGALLESIESEESEHLRECEWMATDFFAPDCREAARHFLNTPVAICCLE